MKNRIQFAGWPARPSRRKPQRVRSGLTLIEMLVATAVTLLLIAGLAQAFQVVGQTVAQHRANVELAGQLRSVTFRLQRDLEGLTAPTRPWLLGRGYFEYIEGDDHDGSHFATDVLPDRSAFGDGDDILMFTSQSADAPFVGMYINSSGVRSSLKSSLAEVVWWSTHTDADDDGIIDPDGLDDFTIYRRALLIRPDLNTQPSLVIGPYYKQLSFFNPSGAATDFNTSTPADIIRLARALKDFYNENDLSVHFVRNPGGVGGTIQVYAVCNSLEDLTDRRNRFAHDRIIVGGVYQTPTFPYNIGRSTNVLDIPLRRVPNTTNENGVIKAGIRQGEDVILPHGAAFDVRAYDPRAVLSAHKSTDGEWGVSGSDDDSDSTTDNSTEAGWTGSDDEIVGPGDIGFADLPFTATTYKVSPASSLLPIGRGAYVDLYYTNKTHILTGTATTAKYSLLQSNAALQSHFSGSPSSVAGSSTFLSYATYDTWPLKYESDGSDQDGDSTTDEGSDGLDSDGANGVDDSGEYETAPPYAVPLRGIQVRIRVIDHSSRQIRQATVVSDFTTE